MNIRHVVAMFVAILFSWTSLAQSAPTIAVEQFLKKNTFELMELSPTGEFIAITVPQQDRTNLLILRRSDMKQSGSVGMPPKSYVSSINWVNPTRVLFSVTEKFYGEKVDSQATGEIYGVNADGSGQGKPLVGYRADNVTPGGTGGSNIKKKSNYVDAFLLDTLKDDDDHVLVEVYEPGVAHTEVHRMNVNSGSRSSVAKAPVRRASFITDNSGVIRFVVGADNYNNSKTYYRDGPKS